MGISLNPIKNIGSVISGVGTAMNLPEFGISEKLTGNQVTNRGGYPSWSQNVGNAVNSATWSPTVTTGATQPSQGFTEDPTTDQAPIQQTYDDGYGGTYSSQAAANASRQKIDFTRAQLDSKEAALRSLLGQYDTTEQQGIREIGDNYTKKLNQGNLDYDAQNTLNDRNRNQALESVDTKVRTDWSGLRRLLAGTGAANESAGLAARMAVARQGSSDRQKQVQTFGDNEAAIVNARNKFRQGLDEEKATKSKNLLQSLLEGRSDIQSQLADLSMQRGAIDGNNYQQIRDRASGYQGAIDANNAKINALPEQYRSVYNTVVTPASLSQYAVDPTAIDASRNGAPQEYSPYSSLLRKKLQEQA